MKKTGLFYLIMFVSSTVMGQYEPTVEKEDVASFYPHWSYSTSGQLFLLQSNIYSNSFVLGTFSPRYNFKQLGKTASLSVGTHAGIGVTFQGGNTGYYDQYGNYYSGSRSVIIAELPIVVQLSVGAGADRYQTSSVGAFVDAGVGLNYISKSYFYGTSNTGLSYGIYTSGGLRFNLGFRPVEIRGSYLYNLEKKLPNQFSIGIGLFLNK